ncbi:hypothetical protein GCM10017779_59830 [Streptomyces capillispiralis]|nr:hypothetical protein GCM10017779_59830 [Streptomyces capillispiralis]
MGELAALLVPARIVVEEVADRVQAEVLGHHLRGGGAEHLLQWFFQCGHGIHCTPRHRQWVGRGAAASVKSEKTPGQTVNPALGWRAPAPFAVTVPPGPPDPAPSRVPPPAP